MKELEDEQSSERTRKVRGLFNLFSSGSQQQAIGGYTDDMLHFYSNARNRKLLNLDGGDGDQNHDDSGMNGGGGGTYGGGSGTDFNNQNGAGNNGGQYNYNNGGGNGQVNNGGQYNYNNGGGGGGGGSGPVNTNGNSNVGLNGNDGGDWGGSPGSMGRSVSKDSNTENEEDEEESRIGQGRGNNTRELVFLLFKFSMFVCKHFLYLHIFAMLLREWQTSMEPATRKMFLIVITAQIILSPLS